MTAAAHDLRAIEAMGEALAGSGKPFVGTSGTLLLAFAALGRVGTEEGALTGGPRVDSENAVVSLARRGVRSSVVRLAPTVHRSLDRQGFVPSLMAMARGNGFAAFVGGGSNRWPALEKAPAGVRLHGVAEEGIPFRDVPEAIGRALGVPTKSVSAEDAGARLGFLATLAQLDDPTSDVRTRSSDRCRRIPASSQTSRRRTRRRCA